MFKYKLRKRNALQYNKFLAYSYFIFLAVWPLFLNHPPRPIISILNCAFQAFQLESQEKTQKAQQNTKY